MARTTSRPTMASHASGPRLPSTPPSGVRGKGAESAWWNGCVDTMYPIPLVPAGASSFVHDTTVRDDLTRFRHPFSPPPHEGNTHKHHGMHPTPSDGVGREDKLSAVMSVSSLRPNPVGVPSRPSMPPRGYGIGARIEPPMGVATSSAAAPPTHEMFMNHHRGRPPAPRPQRHLVQRRTTGPGKLVSPPLPQTHEQRPNKLATVMVPPLSLTGLAVHAESLLAAEPLLPTARSNLQGVTMGTHSVAGGPPQQYGLSAPPGVHSLTLADLRGEFGVALGGIVVPESSSTTTPIAAAATITAETAVVLTTKLTSKNGAASSPSQPPPGAFIPAPPNKKSQYGSIIGGKPLFSPTHRRFVEDVGAAVRSIKRKRMMNKFRNNNTTSSTTSTTSNTIAATTPYRLSSIAAASGTSNRGNVRVFNAPIFPPAKGSPRFRLPSSRTAPNADNVLAQNETVHRQVGGPRKSPRKVPPRVLRALEPPASTLKAGGEIRGAEHAVVKGDRSNKGSDDARRSKGGNGAHLPPPSHTHTSSSLWPSNRNRPPPMDVFESNSRSAADGSTPIAPEIEHALAATTTRKDQHQLSPRTVLKGLPQEAAHWRLLDGRDKVPAYSAALDRGPMPAAYPHRALPRPPLRDQVDHGRPRIGARGKHWLLGGSHGGWSATAQLPSAQPSLTALNVLRGSVRQPAGGGAATHEQHESDTTTIGADPPGGLVFMGGTSILLGGAVMASSLSEYPDVHNMSHAAEQPASPPPPRDYHDFVDDEGHGITLVAKVTIVDAEKVAHVGGEDYSDDGGGGGGGERFEETDEMISDAERMELRRHDWLERAAAVPSPSPSPSPFAANVESGHSLGVGDGVAHLQGLVVVGGLVPTGATFRSFGFTPEAVSAEEEELDTLGGGGGFGYDADNGEAVILRAQREQQVGRGGGDEGTERMNGGVINKEEIGGSGESNNCVSNQSSSQSPTDVLGGQFIRVKLTNEGDEAVVAADVESAIERWSSH